MDEWLIEAKAQVADSMSDIGGSHFTGCRVATKSKRGPEEGQSELEGDLWRFLGGAKMLLSFPSGSRPGGGRPGRRICFWRLVFLFFIQTFHLIRRS